MKNLLSKAFNAYFKKVRTITRGGVPLMTRHYVFPRGPRDESAWPPFSIKLHNLLSSDPGDLHDHPWNFLTIVLRGGYWETTPEGTKWKRPGSVIIHRATDLHRLSIPEGGTWSLFFNWRRVREWGFATPEGWVPWFDYPDELPIDGMLQVPKGSWPT